MERPAWSADGPWLGCATSFLHHQPTRKYRWMFLPARGCQRDPQGGGTPRGSSSQTSLCLHVPTLPPCLLILICQTMHRCCCRRCRSASGWMRGMLRLRACLPLPGSSCRRRCCEVLDAPNLEVGVGGEMGKKINEAGGRKTVEEKRYGVGSWVG